MEKWRFAIKHGWASATGWWRYFLGQPRFALQLLRARGHFFFRRRLSKQLNAPGGFQIDTPDTLIAYWSMFVEHELHDRLWVNPLRSAQNPLVLDVGANAGVFSHFVHSINPSCEIICFEPLPLMVARIRSLAERSGMQLVCHQKAVSNQTGEACLESPHGYDGTSHLVAQDVAAATALKVETVTLDEVLGDRSAQLIKIDVEGFECEVLEGGERAVGNARFLIMEAQTPEHLARITGILGPGWHRKRLGSSDYLFYRPSNGELSCARPRSA